MNLLWYFLSYPPPHVPFCHHHINYVTAFTTVFLFIVLVKNCKNVNKSGKHTVSSRKKDLKSSYYYLAVGNSVE